MKKTISQLILVGSLLLVCSGLASAASLTYNYSYNQNNYGSFNNLLAVDSFNSSLGTLLSVDITMTATVVADFTYKNRDLVQVMDQVVGTVAGNNKISVNAWDFAAAPATNVTSTVFNIAANTTVTDFGVTQTGMTVTKNITSASLENDIMAYLTDNAFAEMSLYSDATSISATAFGGNTDLQYTIATWANQDITLTYNYTAVPTPEPGTMMLLGSGVLMFGGRAFSRFKRKQAPTAV